MRTAAIGVVLLALGVLVGRWSSTRAATPAPVSAPVVACRNVGERLKAATLVASLDVARGAGLVGAAAVECFKGDAEQNAYVKQLEAVNFATDIETARAALQRAAEMLGAAR